jgi:CBS domain-containing protein
VALENLAGLTVRDAMQPLGVHLSPNDRVHEAVRRVGVIPQSGFAVVEGGRLAGIITRSALLDAARKAKNDATVGQHLPKRDPGAATPGAPQISPDEPLADAQERLLAERAAVVVDHGVVIGMITRSDIARLAEVLEVVRSANRPSA